MVGTPKAEAEALRRGLSTQGKGRPKETPTKKIAKDKALRREGRPKPNDRGTQVPLFTTFRPSWSKNIDILSKNRYNRTIKKGDKKMLVYFIYG